MKTYAEEGLRYIAASPGPPHGFHPEAIKTAKAALRLIAALRKKVLSKKRFRKTP